MGNYKKTVIVDSMTNKEILDLLKDDMSFLAYKIDENQKKYAQMVKKSIKKEQLLECFKSYDTDGSGKISFDEFCDMIKPQNEEEKKELFELYKKFDDNGDGEIDFDEFVNGFNNL